MFLKVLWYACQQNYAVWRFLEAFISNKITRNNSKLCPIPNLHQGIYLLVSLLQLVEFASYLEKYHRFDWKSCRELEPSFRCPFQFWGCLEYHQRVDNAIQQINCYSADTCRCLQKGGGLSTGKRLVQWIVLSAWTTETTKEECIDSEWCKSIALAVYG